MIRSELSFKEIVVEVHYNDSSIGMIHQDYLVTRSNISVRIEVSSLTLTMPGKVQICTFNFESLYRVLNGFLGG